MQEISITFYVSCENNSLNASGDTDGSKNNGNTRIFKHYAA